MSNDGELVHLPTPAGAMPAYRWLPDGAQGPGVVMVQEIFGVSTYIRRRAADLAAAGFVVLVPQLYWRLPNGNLDESDPAVLEQAMSLAGQLEWSDATSDTQVALAALRDDPAVRGGVGLLGFCYGGGVAFQVAAQDAPQALVSYYGSALPGLLGLADSITCPSLHHFGTADTYIPMDQVTRIRQTVTTAPVPAQFETYAGAGHAFDNPAPAFHHAGASALAWPRTLEFLTAHLRTD